MRVLFSILFMSSAAMADLTFNCTIEGRRNQTDIKISAVSPDRFPEDYKTITFANDKGDDTEYPLEVILNSQKAATFRVVLNDGIDGVLDFNASEAYLRIRGGYPIKGSGPCRSMRD